MSSLQPGLQPFDLDREGSTWLPRTTSTPRQAPHPRSQQRSTIASSNRIYKGLIRSL